MKHRLRKMIAPIQRRRRAKPGAPPGLHSHERHDDHTPLPPDAHLHLIAFGPDAIEEREVSTLAGLIEERERWPVLWLNIYGLEDPRVIHTLGELFGLHALALEDAVHVHQRPKADDYDDHLFVVLRMLAMDQPSEQLGIFLGDGFVLTLQERPGDCLDPIRQRLRNGRGRVRRLGADYLAYAIMDAVIDFYFPVIETYSERLAVLEHELLNDPDEDALTRIHLLKREILDLRRAIWPVREMVNVLIRDTSSKRITDDTRVYLRDCYDHAVQAIDLVETLREVSSSLIDLYLSIVSNRMNQVMKTLAVVSTMFIPLTFVAGLYGMNFDPARSAWNMPELGWRYGYLYAVGLMVFLACLSLFFFWWQGWLGQRSRPHHQEKPRGGG